MAVAWVVMLGSATIVTTVAALDADTQPLASVAITVNEPLDETVIIPNIDVLLQRYDVPPLAVKTTLSPEQKDVGSPLAEIVAVGKGLIITALAALETLLQSVPDALTTA